MHPSCTCMHTGQLCKCCSSRSRHVRCLRLCNLELGGCSRNLGSHDARQRTARSGCLQFMHVMWAVDATPTCATAAWHARVSASLLDSGKRWTPEGCFVVLALGLAASRERCPVQRLSGCHCGCTSTAVLPQWMWHTARMRRIGASNGNASPRWESSATRSTGARTSCQRTGRAAIKCPSPLSLGHSCLGLSAILHTTSLPTSLSLKAGVHLLCVDPHVRCAA